MKFGLTFAQWSRMNRRKILKPKPPLSERTMQIAKLILWGCVGAMCLSIGFVAVYDGLPARKTVNSLTATSDAVKTFSTVGTKELQVNGDEAHRVLLEAGLTTREARKAAAFQNQFWQTEVPKIAAKANTILDDTDTTVKGVHTDSHEISQAIVSVANTLNPQLVKAGTAAEKAGNAMDQAGQTMNSAGKVIGDPNIPKIIGDVRDGTKSLADAAQKGDHIVGNIDHKVDAMVHPGFWGKVEGYTMLVLNLAKDVIESRYYTLPTTIHVSAPTVTPQPAAK
jgi:hypothetical protein